MVYARDSARLQLIIRQIQVRLEFDGVHAVSFTTATASTTRASQGWHGKIRLQWIVGLSYVPGV